MSEAARDKQHDPTEHRLQKAGREGTFARSRQLSSLIFCCGAAIVLLTTGNALLSRVAGSARSSLGHAPDITGESATSFQSIELWKLATTLAPSLLLLGCVAWLAHAWQSGFTIFPEKLSLDWQRVHPARGLARLFSMRSLTGAIGGMSRLICILAVGLLLVWMLRDRLAMLSFVPDGMLGSESFEIGLRVLGGTVAVMFLFAVMDWLYQSKLHLEGLRLSDQEFRDEMKSIEGDPQVKMRQRTNRAELMQARNDLVAARAADTLLYNRNGDVAAIRFDHQTQTTRLIASAGGIAGQRILKAARDASVPTVADDRLATKLVVMLESGKAIPADWLRSIPSQR